MTKIKQDQDQVNVVTTYEAMEALDVVYNFLVQNDASQPSLTALERIMWFVDEIQNNLIVTQPGSDTKKQGSDIKKKVGFRKMGTLQKDPDMKDKHTIGAFEGGVVLKCGECPYAFSSELDLQEHKERAHIANEESVLNEEDLEMDAEDMAGQIELDRAKNKTARKLQDSDIDKGVFESCKERYYHFSSPPEDKEDLDLEADLSPMTCSTSDAPRDLSCQECGLVMGSESELHDHVAYIHDKLPQGDEILIEEEEIQIQTEKVGRSGARTCLTVQEKQDIIKQYEELPNNMRQCHKAETLGLNRMTLRNILKNREKIFLQQNSAMKRARHSKEKEVEEYTLSWLQAIIQSPNLKSSISPATISRKASEIAKKLGKKWAYNKKGTEWTRRLLRRYNINLEGEEGLNLEADLSPMTCSTRDAPKKFPCQECELVLGSQSEFHDHVAYVHADPAHDDQLPESDEITIKEEDIPKEQGKESKSKTAEACKICGKVYPKSYLYSRHYLMHSDKREFECGLCGKFFKTPGNLKSHMKVHAANDEKFQHCCELCGKCFTERRNLDEHLHVHSKGDQGRSGARICLTVREKQDIIKRYEELPNNLRQGLKAETLGLNRMTLRNILKNREKILSQQNSAMKRERHSKEKEVEKEILAWLQGQNLKSSISLATISKKASEIAKEMGREWAYKSMGKEWARRLLRRHNMNFEMSA